MTAPAAPNRPEEWLDFHVARNLRFFAFIIIASDFWGFKQRLLNCDQCQMLLTSAFSFSITLAADIDLNIMCIKVSLTEHDHFQQVVSKKWEKDGSQNWTLNNTSRDRRQAPTQTHWWRSLKYYFMRATAVEWNLKLRKSLEHRR
jgi:hypothetical protein